MSSNFKTTKGKTLLVLLVLLLMIALGITFAVKSIFAHKSAVRELVVDSADDAIRQLGVIGDEYGYENALSELTEKSTTMIDGDVYYRLQQNYQGIPVYGRTVVVATDEDGSVTSLTGNVEDVYEEVLLEPSVSMDMIADSVSIYIENKLGIDATEELSADDLIGTSLYIYDLSTKDGPILVYKLNWGIYEFLVDAHSASVIKCLTAIYTDMVEFSINGYKLDLNRVADNEDETYYTMVDNSRHIRIYDANDGALSYEFRNSDGELVIDRNGELLGEFIPKDLSVTLVSTNDIEQLISSQSPPYFDEKAISLLAELQTTYDFYKEALSLDGVSTDGSLVWIDGIYDDNMEFVGSSASNAYCWGYAKYPLENVVLSFGTENNIELDTVAHEYTHAVENKRSDMIYEGESGAIKEALSDIFGELVEAWYTNDEPNWEHGEDRNIQKPSATKKPSKYNGLYWGPTAISIDNGYVHKNSTVISHAAYLMWNGIDDTENKKINIDHLAKLWYRAMLMMPQDCDFYTCRKMVELAATSMELTQAQISCVSEAFDQVGITEENVTEKYNISTNCKLHVVGGDGNYYDNYTIEIKEKKFFDEIVKSGFRRTVSVSTAESYDLNLPEGKYVITLTDNADPAITEVFTVNVSEESEKTYLLIKLNFNRIPIKGTVSEVRMENGVETNVPITGAVVTIISHADDTVVKTIEMAKTDGFFEDYLPAGNYTITASAPGYIEQAVSFELKDEEKYFSIQLQPEKSVEPQKLLTEVIYTSDDEYSWTKTSVEKLIYDDKNQLVQCTWIIKEAHEGYEDMEGIISNAYYQYDEHGRLVYEDFGDYLFMMENFEYEYNEIGQQITKKVYNINYIDDRLEEQYDYFYDNQGNLIEEKLYRPSYTSSEMELDSDRIYSYVYDSMGRVLERHSHLQWTRDSYNRGTKYGTYLNSEYVEIIRYAYDQAGRIISESTLEVPENMCSPAGNEALMKDADSVVTYCYDYVPFVLITEEAYSSSSSLAICDNAGNVVWSCGFEDGSVYTLDEDGYIITVRGKSSSTELIYGKADNTPSTTVDTVNASIDAYIPFVEEAIAQKAYDGESGSGLLYDIDDDCVEELIILNLYSEVGEYAFPGYAYSVYDVKDGIVITKCDKEVLFYDAGGPDGYVGVANYLGSTALVVYIDNGETGYQAHRESYYTIYNPDDLQIVASASLDYVYDNTVQVNKCMVNGKDCDYNAYLSFVDAIKPIVTAYINPNDETDGSMGLYKLLHCMQQSSGITPEQSPQISKTQALQIANSVWDEYLKREQGFDWKIFEGDSLVKEGVEYYCYTLQTNSKYGASDWGIFYYLFINSATGEYNNALY